MFTQAAVEVFPDDPSMFLARTPHGYHDLEQIRANLAGAGFSEISIEVLEKVSSAPMVRHPVIGYAQGTPLRNEIEALGDLALELVTEQATEFIAPKFGDGPVSAKMKAHVVVAS